MCVIMLAVIKDGSVKTQEEDFHIMSKGNPGHVQVVESTPTVK